MYEYSLDAFRAASRIGRIVVAIPPGRKDDFTPDPGVMLVEGGPARSLSVANGLAAIASDSHTTDLVVVHDAARPLVTPELIDSLVALFESSPDADSVIAAAPVTDTVKRVDVIGRVEDTLDRSELRAVQTPQVFRRAALAAAIASGDPEKATDDASLIEAAGGSVVVMDSPSFNIKVTVPQDLLFAEALLADRN